MGKGFKAFLFILLLCSFLKAQSDTTPPELLIVELGPDKLDVRTEAKGFYYYLTIKDDMTRLKTVDIVLKSPSGNENISHTYNSTSPILKDKHNIRMSMPQNSEQGNWYLETIVLTDNAGNSKTYNSNTLSQNGMNPILFVYNEEDVSPPEIISLELLTTQVDMKKGENTFNCKLHIKDDLSGIDYYSLTFYSPRQKRYTSKGGGSFCSSECDEIIIFTIPENYDPGFWKLDNIYMVDKNGNSIYLNSTMLEAKGLNRSIEVLTDGDFSPPEITNIDFSPSKIDVRNSSQKIKCFIDAKDDFSGLRHLSVDFQGPSGGNRIGKGFSFTGENSAKAEIEIEIPQNAQGGDWKFVYLKISDDYSHEISYNAEELADLGLKNSFEVISDLDHTVPILKSFAITPSEININRNITELNFEIFAEDKTPSAVDVHIEYSSPLGYKILKQTINPNELTKIPLKFDINSYPGEWRVGRIELWDTGKNMSRYSYTSLGNMGFANKFKVVNEKLFLRNFSISPTIIDVENNIKQLKMEITAESTINSDIKTEVFYQPVNSWVDNRNITLKSNQSGEILMDFNEYSKTGKWIIKYVDIEDSEYNEKRFTQDDLKALGFETEFNVISPSPELKTFSFSPETINIDKKENELYFSIMAEDNSSLFISLNLTLYNSNGYAGSITETLKSGEVKNISKIFENISEPGIWKIDQLSLRDEKGYSKYYSNTQLRDLGFNTEFTLINNVIQYMELKNFSFYPDTIYNDKFGTVRASTEIENLGEVFSANIKLYNLFSRSIVNYKSSENGYSNPIITEHTTGTSYDNYGFEISIESQDRKPINYTPFKLRDAGLPYEVIKIASSKFQPPTLSNFTIVKNNLVDPNERKIETTVELSGCKNDTYVELRVNGKTVVSDKNTSLEKVRTFTLSGDIDVPGVGEYPVEIITCSRLSDDKTYSSEEIENLGFTGSIKVIEDPSLPKLTSFSVSKDTLNKKLPYEQKQTFNIEISSPDIEVSKVIVNTVYDNQTIELFSKDVNGQTIKLENTVDISELYGELNLNVKIIDVENNIYEYTSEDLSQSNFDHKFYIIFEYVNNGTTVVKNFHISKDSVNVLYQRKNNPIIVNIYDEDGIDQARLVWKHRLSINPEPGHSIEIISDGGKEIIDTISFDAPFDETQLALSIRDKNDNYEFFTNWDLEELGFKSTIYSILLDTTASSLINLDIQQDSIVHTSFKKYFKVSLEADVLGFSYDSLNFVLKNKLIEKQEKCLIYDEKPKDLYFNFNSNDPLGDYLFNIQLWDKDNNKIAYSHIDLKNLGFPYKVTYYDPDQAWLKIITEKFDECLKGKLFEYKIDIEYTEDKLPLEYSLINSPGWITISEKGIISGIPENEGEYELWIEVKDQGDLSDTLKTKLVVLDKYILEFSTQKLPNAKIDSNYSFHLETNYTGESFPLSYSLLKSPSWLKINSTGELNGKPDSVGINEVFVEVKDQSEIADTLNSVIKVISENTSLKFTSIPEFKLNEDEKLFITKAQLLNYVSDHVDNNLIIFDFEGFNNLDYQIIQKDMFEIFGKENWFGNENLQIIVNDGVFADTTIAQFEVLPVNDVPFITSTPDTIKLTNNSKSFCIWDCVEDVETSDEDLLYEFDYPKNLLEVSYTQTTGNIGISTNNYFNNVMVNWKATDEEGKSVGSILYLSNKDITNVEIVNKIIPKSFNLNQNYPNPFNPSTNISYSIPEESFVRLIIFNTLGEKIEVLVAENQSAGTYNYKFDCKDIPTGIYLYKLISVSDSGIQMEVKKMVFMK